MQDPDAAAGELNRCVKELGFRGALVNGFSQKDVEDSAVYYDTPPYESFWATVERLGVPFYLHPRDPLFSRQQHYEGHPWFVGPVWAFAVETSIHALRLMASGLLDRHPKLTIILGHLGGADRILFSADYPFENMGDAAEWFDHASISEPDRVKIGRTNAQKLFNLP